MQSINIQKLLLLGGIFLSVFIFILAVPVAASTIFMEPGSDATYGLEFYTNSSNAPTSDTTIAAHTGPRSIQFNSGSGNTTSWVGKNNILADSGRRISAYYNFSSFPAVGTVRILFTRTSAASDVIGVGISNSGTLKMWRGSTQCGMVSGATLSMGTWYRIALSYVITDASNFTAKVYLNGNLTMTATGSDCTLSNTGTNILRLGWENAPGANAVLNIDDVYIDDGADLSDPGDIRVTAKLPTVANDNNFDTSIGNGSVNDRPIDTTNAVEDASTTVVGALQDYTLQGAANGDADVSSDILVARTAWVWARRGTGMVVNQATLLDNGTENSISLTTTAQLYTVTADSSSYPSNVQGIGMRAIGGSGATAATYFYEGGTMIAYKIPPPPPTPNVAPNPPSSLGPSSAISGGWTTATPTLAFTLSDPNAADTVQYRIQISNTVDFSSLTVDYTSALGLQGPTSFIVGQPAGSGIYNKPFLAALPDGSYYWRVLAIDNSGLSSSYTVASLNIAFKVDSTMPTVPGTPSAVNDVLPTWTWASSSDSGSGLAAVHILSNGVQTLILAAVTIIQLRLAIHFIRTQQLLVMAPGISELKLRTQPAIFLVIHSTVPLLSTLLLQQTLITGSIIHRAAWH